MPSLGSLTLPDDPVWVDEFGDWSSIEQSIDYGLTGSQIIDQGVKQGGRPITLDVAWLTRAELLVVIALADAPDTDYVLTIHQGTYTVIFDRPPLIVRAIRAVSDPASTEWYAVAGQVDKVAARAGAGLAGAIDLVGKRMTDLKETIGGVLLPILTTLNLAWADAIGKVQQTAASLSGGLKTGATQATEVLKTLAEGAGKFLSESLQELVKWFGRLDWEGIKAGASSVFDQIKGLGQSFIDLGTAAGKTVDTIQIGIDGVKVVINGIAGVIQTVVSGFLSGLAAIEEAASNVGLGSLERANELRARRGLETVRGRLHRSRQAGCIGWRPGIPESGGCNGRCGKRQQTAQGQPTHG